MKKPKPGRVLAMKNGVTIRLRGDSYVNLPFASAPVTGTVAAIRWCVECRTRGACKHTPN